MARLLTHEVAATEARRRVLLERFARLPAAWSLSYYPNPHDLATHLPETTRGDVTPQVAPAMLSYVSSLHIGLIAWSLQPGSMIRGNNLEDPTAFDPCVPYTCSINMGPTAQGAGANILHFFRTGGD